MTFAATTFLYLLPLAGLPIVFHLILRQRKRTIVFPTLMFFHRVDPKLNTRRRIREWLLLLMRVLMIALILLALSRPTLRSAVGSGGKLSAAVLVDNSGSMTAAADEGDLTKLECAKEGARKLVSSLASDTDAALVLLVDDPAVEVPELLSADHTRLLQCLDRIQPTEASGDAPRALAQAFELLHNSAAGGGVVHVFTDLQRVEWAEAAGRLEVAEDRIHVYLHRIGTAALARPNVAVTGVQLPEQRLLVGQPYELGLALHNTSDSPADIRVNCINDRGERSTRNLSLPQQAIATARLPVTMSEQGFHWLKAWVEGDGFAADNTAGIGLFCEGTGTVLLVGPPREFGILPMAFSPSGRGQLTGLVTQFAQGTDAVNAGWASAQAENATTADEGPHGPTPVLLVTTWGNLAAAGSSPTEVTKYVEAGGNLLVVPSLLPGNDAAPAWLGVRLQAREVHQSGLRLAVLNREAPFWRQMEQIVGDLSAEPMVAYALCPLDALAGFTPLLNAGTGKVVLAQKVLGRGNIFVSGLAFSPRWSTLPLSGLGVVLAQRIAVCRAGPAATAFPANRGAGVSPVEDPQGGDKAGTAAAQTLAGAAANRLRSLVAGERPPVLPVAEEMGLLSLAGDSLDWKGRATELPSFPRTGVYLATAGAQKCCLAVRAAPAEGDWRFLDGAAVPILGPVAHTVVAFDANGDYTKYHAGQARVTDLYVPLLVLATLALFLEGLLSAARVRSRGRSILPALRLPNVLRRAGSSSSMPEAQAAGSPAEGRT